MHVAHTGQSPSLWTSIVPLVIVIGIVVWRNLRPQKISLTRLFLTPVLFVFIIWITVWGNQFISAASPLTIGLAIVIGVLLGIPVGLLRGKHTNVRSSERRGVMVLDASWQTMAIYLSAFGIRYLARLAFPPTSSVGSAIGDGALAFAGATIVAAYYVIYTKFKALEAQPVADA